MGWPKCNSTLEDEKINEDPIWHDWTYHYIGLWISAVFGLIAIFTSFLLIYLHANHYLKPWEQKHIIRILFMVPVYAAVSFLSYKYYTHSVYLEVLRDCYEAFAIASFFSLLCHYIAPDLHQQKNYFRQLSPKGWVWPMKWIQKCWGGERGRFRTPRSGLTWFNVIWTGVFQYCFIRVFMTCVAVGTQAFNLYCLESLNPAFSHVWVMLIEAMAVTIAMYCIIQFYYQLRGDIAEHKPILKVVAIKLVIFLSFWQTIMISFLTSAGAIKANNKFKTPDIKVGIPSMLLCIEMALFSIFHLWAFSYKPYVIGGKSYRSKHAPGEEGPQHYKGGFLGIKAIFDAMNPWDMIKAVGRSAKWLFRDRKNRENDSSYAVSRVGTNMDAFDSDPNGQKLSMMDDRDQSTAYKPGGQLNPVLKTQPFSNAYGEENANLLAHAQGPAMRNERSPYRSEAAYGPPRQGGDIGVASTTDYADSEWSGETRTSHPQSYAARSQGGNGNGGGGVPYFEPPPSDPRRGRSGR